MKTLRKIIIVIYMLSLVAMSLFPPCYFSYQQWNTYKYHFIGNIIHKGEFKDIADSNQFYRIYHDLLQTQIAISTLFFGAAYLLTIRKVEK